MNILPDANETPQEPAPAGSRWSPAWLVRRPRLKGLYSRYEKYVPLLVFATGFIWDTLTMTRVDSVADHIILQGYAIAIAIMIIFTLRRQAGCSRPGWIRKLEPNFIWAMQFAFGGLFSSFVIFYFKSVSWTRTFFFFIILIILLVGNEFLDHRLENPKLLASLYSFCLFSYLSLFLPTVLANVDTKIFLAAGVLSLVLSTMVFALGFPGSPAKRWTQTRVPAACIAAIYVAVNLLYFGNLIPPVPLALKSAGIYHYVARTPAGYEVRHVPPPFYRSWKNWDDPFYLSADEPVYCYTAIFAPRRIRIPVRHIWSYYRPSVGWTTTDRIAFEIAGGREGGYRGFSRKSILKPGKWRVEVETYHGRILGRIDFTVTPSPTPHPALESRIIP